MEPETRLGPYEIQAQLGAGGMGEVYLARDTRLGREVTIKVLPEEYAGDPERLARFEQEARAAAALNHPNIAVVHDIGADNGTHYMVQEYLQGQTLRAARSRWIDTRNIRCSSFLTECASTTRFRLQA